MVTNYDSLLAKKQKLENLRNDLGRKRDATVNRINNNYQLSIDKIQRKIEFNELLINAHKKFVGDNQ